MAMAYTPGLRVKAITTIRRTRRLPVPGKILVSRGDVVENDTVVARAMVPGDAEVLPAADLLGIDPQDLKEHTTRNVGQLVQRDEVVAKYIAFFGLSKIYVRSPMKGTVERISDLTGEITIRGEPVEVSVDAYIPGTVMEVIPAEGVVIQTMAAQIQGIFGVGGETCGQIRIAVGGPDEVLTPEMISSDCKGKIVVGGSLVTNETLEKCIAAGARGIVVGGIHDGDLVSFIGHEMGVAVTGHERVGITLIITEGFGMMNMSSKTFNLLKLCEGRLACINGATQLRAGVIRPEIIVPRADVLSVSPEEEREKLREGMHPGMVVRIIRQPHFGKIGKITALPLHLQRIGTESRVRTLNVELDDGPRIVVPRANVEIIEE